MKRLTPDQVAGYHRHGVLFPLPILTENKLRASREAFAEIETLAGGRLTYAGAVHLFFPWVWDLATDPALLDAAEDIIGPEIVIDSALLLCKYPHDPAFAPWHQDGVYSEWYTTPSVSAWMALTGATIENGCMQVIPGSQHLGRLHHEETKSAASLFGNTAEITAKVDESQSVAVELAAGETSFHHASIVHGSPPNRSESKRLSLVVRFVTPQFQNRKSAFPAVQARGSGNLGCISIIAEPPSGDATDCFTRWKQFSLGMVRGPQARG